MNILLLFLNRGICARRHRYLSDVHIVLNRVLQETDSETVHMHQFYHRVSSGLVFGIGIWKVKEIYLNRDGNSTSNKDRLQKWNYSSQTHVNNE